MGNIIDPYRFELSYYLYLGVQGKFSLIFTLIVVNSLPFPMNWVNYKLLYSSTYVKLQSGNQKFPTWALALMGAPGLGHTIYLWIDYIGSDALIWMTLYTVLFLLSIIVSYMSSSIHRYFFFKKRMEIVLKVYPYFAQPKNARK